MPSTIDTQVALERYIRLKSDNVSRNNQIKRWRDMYFLNWDVAGPGDAEEDHEYVIDNLPHEKIELAVDTLCNQEPIVEVPLSETPSAEESSMRREKRIRKERRVRTAAEQLERFLSGYWERLEAEEQQNIWRMLILDLVSTGYAVARVLWDDEREDSQLPVLIQHIPPETFFALPGRRGHLVQCCAGERPKADVEDEWGITLGEDKDKTAITVEFVDYWEKVKTNGSTAIYHIVFADDKVVYGPVKTDYRDLPYVQVLAKPTNSQDKANEALPFIFGMKDLWETMNRHSSDARDMLRYYADPIKIARVRGGQRPPNFSDVRGATNFLDRDSDEDVHFLQWEGTAPDFFRFGNWLNMAADRVGFNTQLLTGQPGGTESGWHWTQSTAPQKIKLRPYRRAAEWLRQEINRHVLRRLEEHSEVGVVRVYGTDRADRRYIAELDVSKIKGEYYNLVRINDHVPYDEIQIAQLIRTYREAVNGTPFLPDRFLRTTVAQVPYNEEIEQQLADQQIAFHERMVQFMVERALAQQMIQLKAQSPALAGALEEIQQRPAPPPPAPGRTPPRILPGPGLQPMPGAQPMMPIAPPVAQGQSPMGPQMMGGPPGGPPTMTPFMP